MERKSGVGGGRKHVRQRAREHGGREGERNLKGGEEPGERGGGRTQ